MRLQNRETSASMVERGILAKWDDEKGFGFIKPVDGKSPDVFMHISDVRKGLVRRPLPGDVVYYEVGIDARTRKPRACDVRLVEVFEVNKERQRHAAVRADRSWFLCGLFVVLAVALPGYLWLTTGNRIPMLVYTGMSLITFVTYGRDKLAARMGDWRTPETRLHLLELVGGWPGALVAQSWFRHKSSKSSYQFVFWLIVFVHLAAWGDQYLACGEMRKAIGRRFVAGGEPFAR